MQKNSFRKLCLLILFLLLSIISLQFYNTRPIKLQWTYIEAYKTRFLWLDSANFYLKTGKPLMLPENYRLEEIAGGEDQGYPFILSILGRALGIREMTFGTFIKFNYLLLITLGVISSTLLFLSFNSLFIAVVFFYLYLRSGIYDGRIDHQWMIGIYIIFYTTFIIFFIKHRLKFKTVLFGFYFLLAGIAEAIRKGDGIIGILILVSVLMVIYLQTCFQRAYNKSLKSIMTFFYKNIYTVIILIFLFMLPSLTLNVVRYLGDVKFFNGKSSTKLTHHSMWHSAFMGLGYISNSYGIQWDDTNPIKFVRQVNPNVKFMTYEYDKILRRLYFKYSFESPSLWFGNFFAKLKDTSKFLGYFVQQIPFNFFPNKLYSYQIYILLLGIFVLSKRDVLLKTILFTLLIALVMSSIPGFIAIPMVIYLRGLQAAVFMTWFIFVSLIYLRFRDFLKRNFMSIIDFL